ncbi:MULTISPECIES: HAMP domain-containing sensor histidine kinase [Clostridium]|uniref:histidine kinase n=3 Tax=Clostridium TaxID=1485 RepID=D8GUL2_CLOLD|nr:MULTISPECIES: sensor histidine kinase [Clostridium]ADK16889.1 predicted sensory transduction histidine kinase [Clostridium ljungdahlii DSM 13528]OAA85268.1 Sensor histidine kinase GraS [Clostridium ljungdahlii DSM 13528]OAA90833.1 Sensor histidine kinase GraS [Clostridium coskatii]OBR96867.1 sensor histidine kinase GraS [Clostridium coskatii]RMD04378.1 sensor histidine kinase [Clostridium autoethanogenum]
MDNKKVLVNFLKDKLAFTVGYFLNTILILFYGYLISNKSDVIYPLFISIIIYVFIIFNEWIKYYRFNRSFNEGIESRYFDLNPKTNEQKEIAKTIFKIHENYTNKISTIYAQNADNKYFLSQWIHNIKTPTSIIDLVVQKAAKGIKYSNENSTINQTDILRLFLDIREENDKVKSGLDQILNIDRLNSFSKDYDPQEVDFVLLLKEVINSKKNQFIYNNVFPKIEFNYEKILIITDKKWNKFMLEQIISNAIKYSGDSRQKKYVYFNIYLDNKEVKLTIRDEGIGIPGYDIKRVFEPFFTGENGRKVGNATGIGLYICKLISKKLNHNINIDSEVDKGTTFSITYPLKLNTTG